MKYLPINFRLLGCVLLIMALFLGAGWWMIHIDMDITRYLPQKDPVIADGGYIFRNHPIQDQVAIDIGLEKPDPDLLVACGERVVRQLASSGLFRRIGMQEMRDVFPDLMEHILSHLPVMFSARELESQIAPLLRRDHIQARLEAYFSDLASLNGIGQSAAISRDPLGLRDMVLARLSQLVPAKGAMIYRDRILSADGKHLLLIANPAAPGTDTTMARKVDELLKRIKRELEQANADQANACTLTAMGAYRVALDNETIVRQDVNRAIIMVMAGIAGLLILAFPRPLIGLFAFLPAIAGTAASFFVFSLFNRSVSIMALGFGGAIISITVDHGIAYLLFLDQERETHGKAASLEVRAVGLLATLTSMGAFGILYFNDFPIFQQLGLFTAMGIGFSYLFVHTIFPKIFPSLPPARPRALPLQPVVKSIGAMGRKGAWAALGFALVMLFFVKPVFNVNLNAMNTVSRKTMDSEALFTRVWGQGIFNKVHLMSQGDSIRALQRKGDALLALLEQDYRSGAVLSGFLPSMLFPGEALQEDNFAAWKRFWSLDRIQTLKRDMNNLARSMGYADGAFDLFYKAVSSTSWAFNNLKIPKKFYNLLGISSTANRSTWIQFSSLSPGKTYDSEAFWKKYSPICRLFDPALFSQRLGSLLFSSFVRILAILGVSVTLLLFLFFLDLRLTTAALLPLGFALVGTLGTLKIIGHPLDIPGLMLSIVVLGMGVDYSLFLVRSYQRYGDADHPGFGLIRMAVFMAACSTLIGFGVLCFSQHTMLRSVGLTSMFGIIYAFMGAFIILPPIMQYLFRKQGLDKSPPPSRQERVLMRYRNMAAYPRLFARFKLARDPMFSELPRFLETSPPPRTIMDIGCGYGVPACWLAEHFVGCRIIGFDPNPERTLVAARALGESGTVTRARAPRIPAVSPPVDTVLMLDIVHFITDDELRLTLKRIHARLRAGGSLIIRSVVPPGDNPPSLMWRQDALKMKIMRIPSYHRTGSELQDLIIAAGFRITFSGHSGGNEESVWCIGVSRAT